MDLLLLRPDVALHGREIARRTGLPAGTFTRELGRSYGTPAKWRMSATPEASMNCSARSARRPDLVSTSTAYKVCAWLTVCTTPPAA